VARAGKALLFVGTFALLAGSLRGIDWPAVRDGLPDRPAFYLLFLAYYLWLPATDLIAYRLQWTFAGWRSLAAFITKRIYNREILHYSGEFYFYAWARRHIAGSAGDLARTIRDQNILQSIVSTAVAIALVAGFLTLGGSAGSIWPRNWDGRWAMGAGAGAVFALGLLGWLGRRYFAMERRVAWQLAGVHTARFVVEQVLQIWMWSVAVPGVPLQGWFAYAAVSLVISRIPLLTNHDVLFASVGIGMASRLAFPVESVAATMLVIAGLAKAVTIAFFVTGRLAARRPRRRREGASPGGWPTSRSPRAAEAGR
jgi:hypothetical protein